MRLIDADALKKEVNKKKVVDRFNTLLLIDNAPTVKAYTPKQVKEIVDLSKKMSEERPKGECENCDFRKFSETFIDSVVDVMNKNGITNFEQLSKLLKGGAE